MKVFSCLRSILELQRQKIKIKKVLNTKKQRDCPLHGQFRPINEIMQLHVHHKTSPFEHCRVLLDI